MRVVTLLYGQCGNQIGDALFTNLHYEINNSKRDSEYYTESLERWLHVNKSNKWQPRSILIDTECKTIKQNSEYQFTNIVSKSCGGSANNWAFGYFEQSKLLLQDVKECIRKECENNDLPITFLNVFSTSGGTGSGVSSAVIEHLRSEYPKQIITNAVVLPYSTGEVVTQTYNTLLSLVKIYSVSDAFLIFENDRLHYTCSNSLNLKNITFDHINTLLAHQLLSVYQPLKEPFDIVPKLCENPDFKLLQIKLAPLSKLENYCSWKTMVMSLSRQSRYDLQQKNNEKSNLKVKNLSAALICRGIKSPSDNDIKIFKDLNPWKNVQIYHHKRKINNLENCLSVVSNGNNIVIPLYSILKDAWRLYKHGAYIHHYKQFGVDTSCFQKTFESADAILRAYKNL